MDYDGAWKEILEELFEEFLVFFFPNVHKDIDFSKGYQFLEKELHKIIKSSKTGKRFVDKLVKVFLNDGSEKWLLIHIEIQGYQDEDFPERMYVYNYRIFDKFRKEVIGLALLTDDNPKFRPNEYHRSRWGCELLYRYPVVKIIDFRDRWDELEASTQPYSIIVKSYLRTLETEGNFNERYSWKKRFILDLYERGMRREGLWSIYKFVDWIMALPEELEDEIHEEIKAIEETKNMSHITTAERIGLKKGLEQGLEQGVKQGITIIIEIKFGKAGKALIERTEKLTGLEKLQELMDELKAVQSLSEAEKLFDEIEQEDEITRQDDNGSTH